jgi:phosphopantetheine--protein transferase-like protein
MPLVFTKDHHGSQIALWSIEEEEPFFAERIPYRPDSSHAVKRLQQLSSRYLLELMHPSFPFHQVELSTAGKPILPESVLHFSLSHCDGFSAAMLSKNAPVGIDVERINPRILRIETKFLNANEYELLSGCNEDSRVVYATLFWSIKETVFKWWGDGAVDFAEQIQIKKIELLDQGKAVIEFGTDSEKMLFVDYIRYQDTWVTYVEH